MCKGKNMSGYIIGISITLVVLAAGIGAVWFYSFHISNRFEKYIMRNENSVRSFIINKGEKTVRYFNLNQVKDVKTIPLEKFYVPFSSDQIERIDAWLNDLLKKTSDVEEYLECEVYIGKMKKKYNSILKCTAVDYEKKLIHIDSYLFMHLNTRNKTGRKNNDILLEEALRRIRIHPSIKGFTYNFKFACFDGQTKKEMNRLLFTQLKEIAIAKAYPPGKYLLEVSSSEFAVVDARAVDHNKAMDFVHNEVNSIRRFLEINGLTTTVTIAVGMVSNSYFPGNIKKLVNKAQEMSNIAFEKNALIITYSKSMLNNQEDKFDSEIEHVIKEKKILQTFTPIYDISHDRTIGYINNAMPNNTSAKTMNELYLRAVKTDETKKLLQAIVKDAYTLFTEQNTDDNSILFLYLKCSDALSFLSFAKSSMIKETETVAVFDEYDVQYYKNNYNDFGEIIAKFKAKKIQPCLRLSDKSLILDSSVYASFSYFIVSLRNEKSHTKSNVTNIDYRVIVEKLLKYNRPIILSNVIGWTNIELLVRSGINYIASPTLVATDRRVSPISSKNISKIKRMAS